MSSEKYLCCYCGSHKFTRVNKNKNIAECSQCGLRSVFPMPKKIDYQSGYYDTFAGGEKDQAKMWLQRLLVVKKYQQQGNLLDVGAGTGLFVSLASKNFKAEGIEISKYASKRAKDRYQVKVEEKMLDQIKARGKYQVITAWHVLEHLPNPAQSLAQMAGLLSDSGYLFLAVPNDHSLKQRVKQKINYKTLYNDAYPSRENHLYFYTTKTLQNLLTQAGFSVLKIQADDYYPKRSLLNSLKFKISSFLMFIQAPSTMLVVARKG